MPERQFETTSGRIVYAQPMDMRKFNYESKSVYRAVYGIIRMDQKSYPDCQVIRIDNLR